MSELALNLSGDPTYVKVSATDVSASESCARSLAVKTRPYVRSQTWRRAYGATDTFVLGMVAKLVLEAHSSPEAFVGVFDNHEGRQFNFDLLRRNIADADIHTNVKLLAFRIPPRTVANG